ncbi:MAG: hypothetical protein AABW90_01895 [Nanoarchaeota archaeon]
MMSVQNLVELNKMFNKKSKKGISEILALVSLIIITLFAIIIIWNLNKNLITKSPIELSCFNLMGSISMNNICYLNNDELKIEIKRNFDSAKIKKMRISVDPSNSLWEISGKKCSDIKMQGKKYGNYCDVLSPGEEIYYIININGLEKQKKAVLSIETENQICFISDKEIKINC